MFNEENGTTAKHQDRNRSSRALMASAITLGLLALGGCGGSDDNNDAAKSNPTSFAGTGGDDTGGDTGGTGGGDTGGGDTGGTGGGDTGGTGGNPGDASTSVAAFQATLYPLLTGESNCGVCHADNGIGTPTFASVSVELSHQNLVDTQRVDLVDPERSRMYLRLVEDRHNCWSGAANCEADGQVMLEAIQAWAAMIGDQPPTFNPLALASAATPFAMASVEEADTRVSDGLIALYNFEGTGMTVTDVSGVAPAMNLQLENEVSRIEGGGLSFENGRAIASAADSQKLFDRITADGNMSYTVEMWVSPDNAMQTGPARIVNYSIDTGNRNFGLNQVNETYHFRGRNSAPGVNNNGNPARSAGPLIANQMQHVVATFDTTLGRSLYIDGLLVDADDNPDLIADLSNWNASYQFILGNEVTNNRAWAGDLFMVAVYEKSLSAAEVGTNFAAGLSSTKMYLSFDISTVVNTPDTTIRFEVEDFDGSSFLFAAPTVLSPTGANFDMSGMRIAVNGKISAIGQTFADISTTITGTEVELTPLGAVIPKEDGAETDQIMLVFDEIAGQSNVETPTPPIATPLVDLPVEDPAVGIKTFDRMYATLAAVTGIDATTPALLSTYQEFRASLPSNPDPRAFSGATQTVVAKLSLEFCDMWVESGMAANVLTDVNFNQSPSDVFGNGGAAEVAGAVASHFFTGTLSGEPLMNATTELTNLLMAFENTNSTPNAIKAACQASTASAAVMMQ